MRNVLITENDKVVGVFPSIKVAAQYVGVSSATLLGRIARKAVINGIKAEYVGRKATWKQIKFSARASESVSDEEAEGTIKEFAEHGIRVNKVYYEKRHSAILCTLCRKKDLEEGGTFPFVASARGMSCCHFKGKNPQEQYVLCAHNPSPSIRKKV